MSVLNQSGEEQVECPLCMEPLEVDDLNFFPCTCGYQICRFCWHRIRTNENGLCPACRKAYSEDPADFVPLSQEQVAKLKAEKRQRDQQRKAKLSESRKHLASVRVVQRNLVFVVGLPMRLAEPEVLKRHEYFGKFGKIHKVVINQSTSYAGSQGPSASAYVTYMKSDDALRAIQSVNNVTIDGRLIKSSLGTTKYCSHFMKNQPCPKPDCMYLHDFGDPEASFTKEQMHAGKHQEFEKKLHDALLSKSNHTQPSQSSNNSTTSSSVTNGSSSTISTNSTSPTTTITTATTIETININNNIVNVDVNGKVKDGGATTTITSTSSTDKENWPQLNNSNEKTENGKKSETKSNKSKKSSKDGAKKEKKLSDSSSQSSVKSMTDGAVKDTTTTSSSLSSLNNSLLIKESAETSSKLQGLLDDNSSFFSCNGFRKIPIAPPTDDCLGDEQDGGDDEAPRSPVLSDTFPDIGTIADWAAAFGLSKSEQNLGIQQPHRMNFNNPQEDFGRSYDMSMFFDSLKDNPPPIQPQTLSNHNQTGLDQHMSKFFMDFHQKQNGQYLGQNSNGYVPHQQQQQSNGYLTDHERLVMLQQKKMEEHYIGLNLGGNTANKYMNQQNGYYQQQQQQGYQPIHHQPPPPAPPTNNKRQGRSLSEDELDFDPFQETQKALAELMANEQNHKTSGGVHQHTNGIVHNHQGSHLPPPPPGFVQANSTHMNSFGSKILPFLNMSNSQQQISPTQNWSNFNGIQQHPQQQQHKGLNGCNDWKDFDSAIVTTRRHYPFSVSPMRDFSHQMSNGVGAPPQLGTQQQQQQQQLRPQDYMSSFTNFTQQLQQQQQPPTNNFNTNGYSTTAQQQSSLWFASELNSQISSPPGFRSTNQTSKQQEC